MTTMTAREFPLGVILSVTTGRLLCDIGEVYDVLGYMTGDTLWTHQLPRAARECEQPILDQHPDLRDIVVPEDIHSEEAARAFLDSLADKYGASRTLTPLAEVDHTSIDPLTEARFHFDSNKIIPIVIEDPDDD